MMYSVYNLLKIIHYLYDYFPFRSHILKYIEGIYYSGGSFWVAPPQLGGRPKAAGVTPHWGGAAAAGPRLKIHYNIKRRLPNLFK